MQARVQVRLDQLDRLQQLAQALQRVVLALDRDEHLASHDERVDRQQPQARRAVDEHVVDALVPVRHPPLQVGVERVPQPGLSRDHRDQLDLSARQVDRRREAPEVRHVRALLHRLGERCPVDQDLVDRRRARAVLDAERRRRVALRVVVEHEDVQPGLRQRGRDVDGGRRLADPALLVRDRDHPGLRRTREAAALQLDPAARVLLELGHQRGLVRDHRQALDQRSATSLLGVEVMSRRHGRDGATLAVDFRGAAAVGPGASECDIVVGRRRCAAPLVGGAPSPRAA